MERGEVEGGRATGHDWSAASMEPSLKYKTWNHIEQQFWMIWLDKVVL